MIVIVIVIVVTVVMVILVRLAASAGRTHAVLLFHLELFDLTLNVRYRLYK